MSARRRIAVLALALSPAAALLAQPVQPAWVRKADPFARMYTAMAHDAARGVTIMFGGISPYVSNAAAAGHLGDTWAWDGIEWRQRMPTVSPPARERHVMAYDSARRRIVMFGGSGPGGSGPFRSLRDTWEWDGSQWHQMHPSVCPPGRFAQAMVYDAQRQRTLLFSAGLVGLEIERQLWEWDGNDWRQLFPATLPPVPPPSLIARGPLYRMVYDAARGRTVLLWSTSEETSVWEWDGNDFRRHPDQPRGAWLSFTYDQVRRVTVLTTLTASQPYLALDAWDYDGITWKRSQLIGNIPYEGGDGFAATFDSTRGNIVLLGGRARGGPTGNMFISSGSGWLQVPLPARDPGFLTGHEMVFDPMRGSVLLFGGELPGGPRSAETWEWNGEQWLQRHPPNAPAPRAGFAMVYDLARRRTVLFGGRVGLFSLTDETWEWDGSTWSLLAPATRPSARRAHSLAYDTDRGRTILYGGFDDTYLNDTWEFDGRDWLPVDTPTRPPGLAGHTMVYDPVRKRTLLHGGSRSGGSSSDETWEYDGRDWQKVGTGTRAPHHRLLFHGDLGRPVLLGGQELAVRMWDGQNWQVVQNANHPGNRNAAAVAYDSARGVIVLYGGFSSGRGVWELRDPNLARYATFGSGCLGSSGVPTLTGLGQLPRMGQSFQVRVDGVPPGSPVFMLLGFSKSRLGDLILPLDLTSPGMPGCSLYTSVQHSGLLPDSVGGSTTWTVNIGTLPGLLGLRFYHQAFVFDPGANALGLTSSNAGSAVIGR